jgi:hypothetical protein
MFKNSVRYTMWQIQLASPAEPKCGATQEVVHTDLLNAYSDDLGAV